MCSNGCEAMCLCLCLCLCLCRGLRVLLLLQKMFSYSRMCSLTTGYVLDRSLGVLLFYYRMCSLTQECVLLLFLTSIELLNELLEDVDKVDERTVAEVLAMMSRTVSGT